MRIFRRTEQVQFIAPCPTKKKKGHHDVTSCIDHPIGTSLQSISKHRDHSSSMPSQYVIKALLPPCFFFFFLVLSPRGGSTKTAKQAFTGHCHFFFFFFWRRSSQGNSGSQSKLSACQELSSWATAQRDKGETHVGRQTWPFCTGQLRHSVALEKVEYLAVTKGMQREHVKPLHASYVKNGEGETIYHTGWAGLLCLSLTGEGETGWQERRGRAVVPEPQSFLAYPPQCQQHYEYNLFFFFWSVGDGMEGACAAGCCARGQCYVARACVVHRL